VHASRAKVLLFLFLGGLFFVGGGAFLVYWCFSGDTKSADASAPFQLPDPDFKPLPPRPLISLSQAEQARVNEAMGRAVAFLKKTQGPDGTWPGPHPVEYAALAGMTLLECGVGAADPTVQKAAAFVRQKCPEMNRTYGLSLYLLFLHKLNETQDRDRIKELALRLVAGQSSAGGWTYVCPIHSRPDQEQLFQFLKDLGDKSLVEFEKSYPGRLAKLPAPVRGLNSLQTPPKAAANFFRQGGDNSNTQFALLALWAARSRDVPVDRCLDLVVRRFRSSQNGDGSWNYSGGSNASPGNLPTMTCAGLLALAVGYGLPSARRLTLSPDRDQAIQKALHHLSRSIGKRSTDPKARPPLPETYFLWSVERVGVLFQLKVMGDREWYQWGMDILLANQNPDGSWKAHQGHGSSNILDTCFGLLFLQRANLVQDLTDKIRELVENQVGMIGPAVPRPERS
jgi:hypothetical protein